LRDLWRTLLTMKETNENQDHTAPISADNSGDGDLEQWLRDYYSGNAQ
jgi:hypothetical protein